MCNMGDSATETTQQSDAVLLPEKEDAGETTTQPSLDESTTDNENESASTTKSIKDEADSSEILPPKEIVPAAEDEQGNSDTEETPSLQAEPENEDSGAENNVDKAAVGQQRNNNDADAKQIAPIQPEKPSSGDGQESKQETEKQVMATSEEVSENTLGSMTESSDIHDSVGESDLSNGLDHDPSKEMLEVQNSDSVVGKDKATDHITKESIENSSDFENKNQPPETDPGEKDEQGQQNVESGATPNESAVINQSTEPVAVESAEKVKSKRHKHPKKSSKRNMGANEKEADSKGEKEGKRDKMKRSSSERSSKRNLKKEKESTEEKLPDNGTAEVEESANNSNVSEKLRKDLKKTPSNRKKHQKSNSGKNGEDVDATSAPSQKTVPLEKDGENEETTKPPKIERSQSHRKADKKKTKDSELESTVSKSLGEEKSEKEAKLKRSASHRKSKKSIHKNKSKGNMGEKSKGSVSFASVTIHYHEVQVGNNLDCDGPPLALGDFRESEVYEAIDAYEESLPYRPKRDPRLSAMERLAILQKNGITFNMIMAHLHVVEKQEKDAKERKKRKNRQNVLKPLMCVFGKKPNPSSYE